MRFDKPELPGTSSVKFNHILTARMQELQMLYDRYSTRGLEILGFPCNQFGGQEPGTNAEIQGKR
jgi:glutathione peroxidase-family protein